MVQARWLYFIDQHVVAKATALNHKFRKRTSAVSQLYLYSGTSAPATCARNDWAAKNRMPVAISSLLAVVSHTQNLFNVSDRNIY